MIILENLLFIDPRENLTYDFPFSIDLHHIHIVIHDHSFCFNLDFGNDALAEQLRSFKPLRGVYGNIDGQDIRAYYPELLQWTCEEVHVMMLHIGGYPPKYNSRSKPLIQRHKPQLFISGHSHILKVMYDDALNCLHINPGAAGKQGWHKVRTLVRLDIDGSEMKNCRVIELGGR